ncbi:hypothetical protein PGTUg99_020817 [Puccinia graminis f. sp. tritici]|uniref:Uncharacterized protein n=1 Tax=Puccinia graminis f. sp. tritici TaxID=56615 RepID=A0A5B0SIF1_PUCGR|nr:hypothetical protein PGTUg99_031140 [Puccinia graminis f. sp. tritici]KAA1136294.1 hypothetical protein PGTUg99_020817 [Puccinia graminis f. sp. tritici]
MSGETGERERRSGGLGVPGRPWPWTGRTTREEGRRARQKAVRQQMGVVWDRHK